eukprot:TRINITY_DN39821_c0_g1_i1.p1 TRINITY_DN39821_c0_g1~~TRINITY_DN39821_c0_g1_i1.p1  ORF type:complete len:278 (+),score=72.92 TRINITY_DN39821_c0_g1_i1:94-927(+)
MASPAAPVPPTGTEQPPVAPVVEPAGGPVVEPEQPVQFVQPVQPEQKVEEQPQEQEQLPKPTTQPSTMPIATTQAPFPQPSTQTTPSYGRVQYLGYTTHQIYPPQVMQTQQTSQGTQTMPMPMFMPTSQAVQPSQVMPMPQAPQIGQYAYTQAPGSPELGQQFQPQPITQPPQPLPTTPPTSFGAQLPGSPFGSFAIHPQMSQIPGYEQPATTYTPVTTYGPTTTYGQLPIQQAAYGTQFGRSTAFQVPTVTVDDATKVVVPEGQVPAAGKKRFKCC